MKTYELTECREVLVNSQRRTLSQQSKLLGFCIIIANKEKNSSETDVFQHLKIIFGRCCLVAIMTFSAFLYHPRRFCRFTWKN